MRGERGGLRKGAGAVALLGLGLGLGLALAGCGSTSSLLSKSPLDIFSSSSKAIKDDAGGEQADATPTDVECPGVEVRTGAATLIIGSKPGEGPPAALDIRYQGSFIRTARECHVSGGVMTMKVGVEGRIITGPAGGPGTVDVPLRIAVVQEGVTPKPILSKFARVPVTVTNAVDRVNFTHIDSEITFPLPTPLALIDAYVVYVGFDPLAKPEKKTPVKRAPAKPRTPAKPKQS